MSPVCSITITSTSFPPCFLYHQPSTSLLPKLFRHSMNNQPQHISTLTHLLMFLPSGLLTSMIAILDLFTPRASLQTRKLDTSTMPANIARGSGSLRRRAVGKFIQHHSHHVRNSMDDRDGNASGKGSQRFKLRWQVVCILSVSASADG